MTRRELLTGSAAATLIVAAPLLLQGCSKPASVETQPEPMTGVFLNQYLSDLFLASGYLADSTYYLPSYKWVTNDFTLSWLKFKETFVKWTEQKNDCDDFARGAAFFAQLLHHNTARQLRGALAFGEMWYKPSRNRSSRHAINFALYRLGGIVYPAYYEPQNGTEIKLTLEEARSCDYWRI
jgi:hypothetical protein